MSSADWLLIIGSLTTLVAAITTGAIAIIKALQTNTQATQATAQVVAANTEDRAVKTAITVAKAEETNGTLAKVAQQVADLHDVTVIAPAASPPASGGPIAPPTG